MTLRDSLAAQYDDELMFLAEAEYDEAIIGVVEGWAGGTQVAIVVYDRKKLIDVIARGMTMPGDKEDTRELAEEFFEFNIVSAYVGPTQPMYFTSLADAVD